jgi:hypothetical protein
MPAFNPRMPAAGAYEEHAARGRLRTCPATHANFPNDARPRCSAMVPTLVVMEDAPSKSSDDQPPYLTAVRDLILANHVQDPQACSGAQLALSEIGWGNGPGELISATLRVVLESSRPDGFEGRPLDMVWMERLDESFTARHNNWLKMYPNLNYAIVQAARGYGGLVASFPRDFLALRRASLIEHGVETMRPPDVAFEEALDGRLQLGHALHRRWSVPDSA